MTARRSKAEGVLLQAKREAALDMRERAANLIACNPSPTFACSGTPKEICNACYRALQIRQLPLPGEP